MIKCKQELLSLNKHLPFSLAPDNNSNTNFKLKIIPNVSDSVESKATTTQNYHK